MSYRWSRWDLGLWSVTMAALIRPGYQCGPLISLETLAGLTCARIDSPLIWQDYGTSDFNGTFKFVDKINSDLNINLVGTWSSFDGNMFNPKCIISLGGDEKCEVMGVSHWPGLTGVGRWFCCFPSDLWKTQNCFIARQLLSSPLLSLTASDLLMKPLLTVSKFM